MINTKQVYDNIPTVNKPEIERVFNEMMDKLKRPRKKFISLDSYKSGSEYINWDYSYLKMRNPSINTYHIEGVGNECQTVAGALAYRM